MAQLSDRMRALVQPHLSQIEPYDPAFSPTRISLSANENTHPFPEGVRAAVDAALAATPLNRYPDPMANDLRDLLAAWHGVARENICVGNGGDELLFNFILAFGGPDRPIITCPPDFSEYALFASLVQAAHVSVMRDPETFEIDRDALLAQVGGAGSVILTSPNNPTGNLIPLDLIDEVCAAHPGLVLVDEAYGEFAPAGTSAESLLARHANLVVLHTFSKAFAAAGIRCGYVIAAPDVIEVFAAVRQVFSVNVLVQAAACAVVPLRDAFAPVIEEIKRERTRLLAALGAPPFAGRLRVWPSEGNFLLVRIPQQASAVRARLRDECSILVRDFSQAPGLKDCLRITVGTREENDAVLAALERLVCEEGR